VIGEIIDITRPLGPATAVWPGDVPFSRSWTQSHGSAAAAVSRLEFSPHLGTHVDAPLHIDPAGGDVASIPLSVFVGPCEVVGLPGHDRRISHEHLPPGWKPSAPRVLFATWTWPTDEPVSSPFPSLSPGFVDFLARARVMLVGLDSPSVDEPTAVELPAHKRCIEHAITIIEGLDFTGVLPALYTLVAAPLRLPQVEASPIRAFLMPATTEVAESSE
jgi:arylformamidase